MPRPLGRRVSAIGGLGGRFAGLACVIVTLGLAACQSGSGGGDLAVSATGVASPPASPTVSLTLASPGAAAGTPGAGASPLVVATRALPPSPPTAVPATATPPLAVDCAPPADLLSSTDSGLYLTNEDEVNLRVAPGTACDVLTTLAIETEVTIVLGPVIADGRPWLLVETGDATGWIARELLSPAPAAVDGEIVILLYHRLDAGGGELSVQTPQLRQQLGWLRDQGYRSITIGQLVAGLRGEIRLPPRPVVITNDDGYPETIRFAEELAAFGFTGTFYLPDTTSLTEDQIRSLEQTGAQICGHSSRHQYLPSLSLEEQQNQIGANLATLERILGHPIDCFAYPFGAGTAETVSLLGEFGIESAVEMDGGALALDQPVDLLRLPRAPVQGTMTLAEFQAIFPNGEISEAG